MDVKKQLIQGALAFMERSQLQASEIDAYTAVKSHLIDLLQAGEAPPWDVPKAVDEQPDLAEK